MKEIVVISGKGGTGKTSITASLAYNEGTNIVVADCDVDAADMHLLLEPDFKFSEDFYSGEVAYIHQNQCSACGECASVCRFNAIHYHDGKYQVDPVSCEGCGYCSRVCPTDAIENKSMHVGQWFSSGIKTGGLMIHAKLGIGADNSGKLVAKVKSEAKKKASEENINLILVDGSPGVGCPVVSSLSGASFVILVTEPSVSGLHDLRRVYALVKKFRIRAACIINKSDINATITQDILDFLEKEKIIHLGNLPYDESFTRAMIEGKTIVESEENKLGKEISIMWEKVKQIVFNN